MTLSFPPNDRPDRSLPAVAPAWRPPQAYAPAPGEEPAPEPLDWRRVWAAVRRWKWLVAGCTAAGVVLGLVATRFVPPAYRAQATIWIDSRDRREGGGPAPMGAGRLLDPEAWLDLARSYAVLDDAARHEQLYLHHTEDADRPLAGFDVDSVFRTGNYRVEADGDQYVLRTADGVELDRVTAGDSLGKPAGFLWAPPAGAIGDDPVKFEVVTLRDASTQLSEQLELHIDPDGNLLRLGLEGSDPARLAGVLDRVAERYVAIAGELKRQKLTQLTGILSEQLASASQELVDAESTYQAFRARTITLPSERPAAGAATTPAGGGAPGPDPASDRYFSLQSQRGGLQREREAIERALTSGEGGGVNVGALGAIPAAKESRSLGPALDDLTAKESQLRELRTRYSDEHPEVIQLAARVASLRDNTIPALAQGLANDLRSREGLARRDELSAGAELRRIPARSLEEARLRRTVALAEDLHNTLQQRTEEARLAEASTLPDARVLDRAVVPRAPVRDSALRLFGLAVFGSLGFGLLAAVLLDRADPRFRYPSQVSRELGLPIIGTIPHVPRPGTPADQQQPLAGGVAPLVEALRGIRMSILNSVGDANPLLLTISSPGSGDGKSFLASHLAFTFAQAGYRTVLVDGDMRRGRLHRRFGAGRRPGLCEVLQGTPLDEALRQTDYPSLTLLPCGTNSQHGPEFLAGPRMGALMSELRRRFQVVLLDSPPLSAGIDPYVESVATGRLLLVLRNGVSHRELMTAKLGVLGRMPIDLLGVVMNDVPADPSYAYFSYYLPGYEAKDEEEVPPPAVVR